jgi:hypothetical protein
MFIFTNISHRNCGLRVEQDEVVKDLVTSTYALVNYLSFFTLL